MPQLNTRNISAAATLPCRCSQSKIGGRGHDCAVDARRKPFGEHPVRVLAQAAAGDVRHSLDLALGQECQHRLDIDARRLEQRLAERALAGDAGDLLREVGVPALEDAADQRKAVRMRSAGGEPEQYVAGSDARGRRSHAISRRRRRRIPRDRIRRERMPSGARRFLRRPARIRPARSLAQCRG